MCGACRSTDCALPPGVADMAHGVNRATGIQRSVWKRAARTADATRISAHPCASLHAAPEPGTRRPVVTSMLARCPIDRPGVFADTGVTGAFYQNLDKLSVVLPICSYMFCKYFAKIANRW